MAEFVVTTGHDAYVSSVQPTLTFPAARYPALKSGSFQTLLFMPLAMSRISGKTIVSATLSCPTQSAWVSQTLSFQALSAAWNASTVTWNNQPGVTGAIATDPTGALTPPASFSADVKTLVQAIADGQANYGWRVTTSQSTDRSTVRGFSSGFASWTLTVEVSDLPPTPEQLSPAGVISVAAPVVTVDETDNMAAIQVQVDPDADGTTPEFDSGWRATTTPQLDLSAGMGRTVSVTTTNGSPTISFAANLIEDADHGATITGTGIPGGTTITATPTSTTATLSANATASGTIAATVTRTYAGLADGSSTDWRARVKLTDGAVSEWSSWVEITRAAKPSIVMDSPAATDIWDPTPTIEAHLSPAGDADTRWQVIITAASDPADRRYDSGDALSGATLEHTVPLTWNGRTVMPEDGSYVLEVRAWDRTDRVASVGAPTSERESVSVTLSADAGQTAPATLVAAVAGSGYPDVTLTWTRASAPAEFVVMRDGKYLATVDPVEYLSAPLTWEWVDENAVPNVTHTYAVRAKVDVAGLLKQSEDSPEDDASATVSGVWLRSSFGDVQLLGNAVENFRQVDKRQTFVMPYRSENVDIVTAIGGFEGSYTGLLAEGGDQDVDDARAILADLRAAPMTDVRLVWGTQNIWVHLRGLSVTPHPQMIPSGNRAHSVSFEFFEIDPAA